MTPRQNRGFTDQRSEHRGLGVRAHLGGGATLFDVQEGSLHDVLPGVVVEYMKQQGWTVMVCPHGIPCDIDPKPDLVLHGRILEFSANAKSRPFSTRLTAHIKVTLEAEEGAQGRVRKKHFADEPLGRSTRPTTGEVRTHAYRGPLDPKSL